MSNYTIGLQAESYSFVGPKVATERTGLSRSTLKRYRLSGKLTEGIHWIRLNSRNTKYNLTLLLDWIQNQISAPNAHQKAVDNYLATLPSNQKAKRVKKQLSR